MTRCLAHLAALATLALAGGCLSADARLCVSGALCAPGFVCDDVNGICVLPGSSVCGNGVVEAPEECDEGDANSDAAGASCLTNCRVPSACGDGITSPGEQCDDGNLRSHDGCSSICSLETLAWKPFDLPGVRPPPRSGAVLVHDPRDNSLWLAGGRDAEGDSISDLWRWNGVWKSYDVPDSPFVVPFYDKRDQAMRVLTRDEPLKPVGAMVTWQVVDDALVEDHQLAGVGDTVYGAGSVLDLESNTVFAVVQRVDANFDASAEVLVLHEDSSPDEEPWLRVAEHAPVNGLRATTSTNVVELVVVEPSGLARDAYSGELLASSNLPGTIAALTVGPLAMVEGDPQTVYHLQGGGWGATTLMGADLPPGGWALATAFGSADSLFAFGGLAGTAVSSSLWRIELGEPGYSWTAISQSSVPDPRRHAGFAWDRRRGRAVLFGGGAPDAWEYDGDGWSALPAPPTTTGDLGYDPVNDRFVLRDTEATWQLVGLDWRRFDTPETGTPTLSEPRLVYDRQAAQLRALDVGNSPQHFALSDVFWEEQPSPSGPLAGAAVAYDPVNGVTVAHGATTWTLTDGTWTEVVADGAGPGARAGAAMTWNPDRERIVLHGGVAADGGVAGDVWEFDVAAGSWSPLAPSTNGPTMDAHRAVYDETNRQLLMVGDSIWTLGWTSEAPEEDCASPADDDGDGLLGCDDPDCSWRQQCEPETACGNQVGQCFDTLGCTTGSCVADACEHVIAPGYCVIDAACVAEGTPNPEGTCVCAPEQSLTEWFCAGGPFCGNASIQGGETCDDGNRVSGDGCSAECQHENVCVVGLTDAGGFETFEVAADGAIRWLGVEGAGSSKPVADIPRPQSMTACGRRPMGIAGDGTAHAAVMADDGSLVVTTEDGVYGDQAGALLCDSKGVLWELRFSGTVWTLYAYWEGEEDVWFPAGPVERQESFPVSRVFLQEYPLNDPTASGVMVFVSSGLAGSTSNTTHAYTVSAGSSPNSPPLAMSLVADGPILSSIRLRTDDVPSFSVLRATVGPCLKVETIDGTSSAGNFGELCDPPLADATDVALAAPGSSSRPVYVSRPDGAVVFAEMTPAGLQVVDELNATGGPAWLRLIHDGAVLLVVGEDGSLTTLDTVTRSVLDTHPGDGTTTRRDSVAAIPCYVPKVEP